MPGDFEDLMEMVVLKKDFKGSMDIISQRQDGRVVKAGALGDAHVKSWDRIWSNPGFEKAHRVGLVLKLRPLVTVAGVSQIWEMLMLSRGIEPGQILTSKKSI